MQKSSRYIMFMGAAIGCISGLYFLTLLLAVPFAVAVFFIVASLFFLYRGVMNEPGQNDIRFSWWMVLLLVAGICIITNNAVCLAPKHGDWDAWSMWNFHSKYLADQHDWKRMFQNTESDHLDYPLCLPSCLGFFIRLFSHHYSLILPFVFSFLITLCIPVLIYIEQAGKNIVIAAATLFLFSQDTFYIARGVSQYADTLLAFFFLCSFICMDHAAEGRKYIALSALFLGCCAWTKNEGIALAAIFLLFYSPVFFSKRNLMYTVTGLTFPVIVVLILKTTLHGDNDLVNASGNHPVEALLQKERYKMIYDSFMLNLNMKFYFVKIGIYLYALLCIIEKQLPGRQMLLLLTCTFAYAGVYLFSPYGLDWHLGTSQDRLMHQLMPAFMYVLAVRFSKIQFSLPKQVTL